MHKQILIIFKFKSLFRIINELENELNFNVIEVSEEIDLKNKLLKFNNSLIVTQKKGADNRNQLILNKLPDSIYSIIEKINVCLLKQKYSEQSDILVGKYSIDINSRLIRNNTERLKLTEREIQIIIFLNNSKGPRNIENLQRKVWGHNSSLETHTVETHIYRLRKKIKETFNDDNFLLSRKEGYTIK